MTVFLTIHELPRDDDGDDDYSTISLMVSVSKQKGNRTSFTMSQPTTVSDTDRQEEKNEEDDDDDEDASGRQVLGRVRVRRDALDHLGTQHVDEMWRSAEDLLERSAVADAKRRQGRRRREVDYWHHLTTLLQQLDQVDKITVRHCNTLLIYQLYP